MKEFTRVFKIQIEEQTGTEVESTDSILQWAVRWAAMVCSRYLVGADGKTGWERRRGRPCLLPVCALGEKVWYKQIRKGKYAKINWKQRREKESGWDQRETVMKH